MSLPPGFLDELRTRVSLSQVVGRKVTWDSRKSNVGKGDYWTPCPFHQEKTASFHVDDRKGFFYCFGCHAKGDAIGFIKDTENVSFIEAVEILAQEAGMPVPKSDPRAQEKSDRNKKLAEVMEQAVQYFRLQLHTNRGADARGYLDRRGLSEETLQRFEIGFAPDDRHGLTQHLVSKRVDPRLIVETGMAIQPDDGGKPYDRFRGRIMFPIRDIRGRCIAFGGRAMDPNARAKYLNSPETPLFDKGRSLYNQGPAREASGKTGSLIVAEGYMDVIALAQAGFNHAVAPLGTAITEDQLRLMWRIAEEPVIALDGDKAGLRAAMRLIDNALPLLEAGKSLRFSILPEGLDPDDLIKSQGASAMQTLLDSARPLVDLLWQRETEDKVFDSPERRAALDKSLREAIKLIKDPSLRSHYGAAIQEKRQALFKPQRGFQQRGFQQRGTGQPWRPRGAPMPATPGTKASILGSSQGDGLEARIRESAILAGCLNHPALAEEFESQLDRAPFQSSDLAEMRNALLSQIHQALHQEASGQRNALIAGVAAVLGYDPMEKLLAIGHVRTNPHLRANAGADLAKMAIAEELAKHNAMIGLNAEIREAEETMTGIADEGVTWRLQQASEERDRVLRGALGDDGNEIQDESELSKDLQKLIDQQIWKKKQH